MSLWMVNGVKYRYKVLFNYGKDCRLFRSKRDIVHWLKDGMYGCDGAERDHYVNMMAELDCGRHVLHY